MEVRPFCDTASQRRTKLILLLCQLLVLISLADFSRQFSPQAKAVSRLRSKGNLLLCTLLIASVTLSTFATAFLTGAEK